MATPTSSRGWPATLIFLSLSVFAFKEMHLSKPAVAVRQPIQAVVKSLVFPDQEVELRETYTGIPALDLVFRNLVAAFLPGVAGWDKSFQIQQIYFLFSFFPILTVLAVEAGRKKASSLIRRTSIWALFYQTVGGAVVISLYFLALSRNSGREGYWSPASRQLSASYARALLPSLLIGYLLPTILMYLPFSDPGLEIHQALIALWQPCPAFVNLLLIILSALYEGLATSKKSTSAPQNNTRYLRRVYSISFIISAVAHLATINACLSSSDPSVSLMHTLVRAPVDGFSISMTQGLRYIFQVDFWFFFTACVIGAYLALWDLKKMGKVDMSQSNIIVRMAIALVCIGPGATVAGVWHIREQIMSEKDEKRP